MFKPMMCISVVAFGGAIALSPMASFPTLAAPEFCPDTNNPIPAQLTRTVELKQFGVNVQIPANYRTLLRNDGTVSILAPGDFNLIQCLAKGIPVKGTDAVEMDTFKRHPNPEELTLKDFVLKNPDSKFSDQILSESINTIEILVREAPEQGTYPGSAHAWYQLDGVNGIVEVMTSYKTDLLDLLKRTRPIKTKSVVPLPTPPVASAPTEENLLILAFNAAKELGYAPTQSFRETVLRQNDRGENPTQSTVTITQEGLLDDSIAGHQFMIQFQKNADGRWEMIGIQKKRKCQPGRGAQSYESALCV